METKDLVPPGMPISSNYCLSSLADTSVRRAGNVGQIWSQKAEIDFAFEVL